MMEEQLCQISRRYALSFFRYSGKTAGGGNQPPGRAKANLVNVRCRKRPNMPPKKRP